MINEIIFCIYCSIVGCSIFGALLLGQSGLIALMSLFFVCVNLFVTKHITIFGVTATAADPLSVGIPLAMNVLQEHHPAYASKRAIWVSFYMTLVYVMLAMLHVWYTPADVDTHHYHFSVLLSPMPRVLAASLTAYLISQFSDRHIYYVVRRRCTTTYAFIATLISTTISQAIDTVTFTMLGLYGIMHNLREIMLVSYILKLATVVCIVPFTIVINWAYRSIDMHAGS